MCNSTLLLQASFAKGAAPTFTTVHQPAGWQCLLHTALLDGDVISLALAPQPRLLAAGDAKGRVMVLDLAKVRPDLWRVTWHPVAQCADTGACSCQSRAQRQPAAADACCSWQFALNSADDLAACNMDEKWHLSEARLGRNSTEQNMHHIGMSAKAMANVSAATLQPMGLWATDLGMGPIPALALGMHVVPPNQRRSISGSGETRFVFYKCAFLPPPSLQHCELHEQDGVVAAAVLLRICCPRNLDRLSHASPTGWGCLWQMRRQPSPRLTRVAARGWGSLNPPGWRPRTRPQR